MAIPSTEEQLMSWQKYAKRMAGKAARANVCLQIVINDKRDAVRQRDQAREQARHLEGRLRLMEAREASRAGVPQERHPSDKKIDEVAALYADRTVSELTPDEWKAVALVAEARWMMREIFRLRGIISQGFIDAKKMRDSV